MGWNKKFDVTKSLFLYLNFLYTYNYLIRINFYKDEDFKLSSKSIIHIQDSSYYFQIYVFDEHQSLLNDLEVSMK